MTDPMDILCKNCGKNYGDHILRDCQTHTTEFSPVAIPDWLPIENAPKDGTIVDLWCEHDDNFVDGKSCAMRITDCWWIDEPPGWETCDPSELGEFVGVETDLEWTATHWMLAPKAPS